jgi:hypothetical protein
MCSSKLSNGPSHLLCTLQATSPYATTVREWLRIRPTNYTYAYSYGLCLLVQVVYLLAGSRANGVSYRPVSGTDSFN